jgi:hypothetical protein
VRWALAIWVVAGCSHVYSTHDQGAVLALTIDRTDTVGDATAVLITFTTDGGSTTEGYGLDARGLPATLDIERLGRTGPVTLSVSALDPTDVVVGRGTVVTSFDVDSAMVMLDGVDFIVNTSYAGSQYLASQQGGGLQLATTSATAWTAAFAATCNPCSAYARRFDPRGKALASPLSSGTNEFEITNVHSASMSAPAIAATSDTTLAVWDFIGGATQAVACRSFDAQGAPRIDQVTATPNGTGTSAVSALGDGMFVVTWQTYAQPMAIHAQIVTPTCTPILAAPIDVSPALTSSHDAHTAVNAGRILYVWVSTDGAHMRFGYEDGTFAQDATMLVANDASYSVGYARAVRWGSGFGVVVRWVSSTYVDGKIEVYQLTSSGVPQNVTTVTTTVDSIGSGYGAVGVAERSGGTLLVVWHTCPAGGCDVYGRFVAPTGEALDKEFVVPTTTMDAQHDPSVTAVGDAFAVAWTDDSRIAPDSQGSAVRARILHPAP